MRVVIQRVLKSIVKSKEKVISQIGTGLVLFVGVEIEDNEEDADWLTEKIVNLRIISDDTGKMNKSLKDTNQDVLVISQFTLHAKTKKGNRPSFIKSANHEDALFLYNYFIERLQSKLNVKVKTGKFGADMNVNLINNGPVTIIIDSKQKE
ncbi:MAG: D-tyrosyl-tRNA(Tyr) deacylase [Flavobacteriales bacterium]|nr:D-tyrosyl-tRNA(Tyr) deacylase [Flavobacteriales bacterium]|tara:strand:+ start:9952 stop:10404 length:453 start_codon:yes stop_codon:yes gene_type:complete